MALIRAAGLSLLAALLLGADWPTNVVPVTNSILSGACSGVDTPYECCTGAGAGCNGFGGEDIQDALQICELGSDKAPGGVSDPNGCILQLPCNQTIANAENSIGDTEPTTGSDVHGIAYTEGFFNGLVIQGCGTSTLLQSRIPPARWTGGSKVTAAIFYFDQWDPAGAEIAGLPRLAFRDFACDGQSPLQPSDDHSTTPWNETDYANLHSCIGNRLFPEGEPYRAVEVKRVWAHHFTGAGFQLGRIAQALLTGNTVDHIGCWQDFDNTICNAGPGHNEECVSSGNPFACCTGSKVGNCTPFPCCTGAGTGTCNTVWANGTSVVGEVPCGCAAGDPGDCREWEIHDECNVGASGSPGFKTCGGFGIQVGDSGKTTIANNSVSLVTKYGLSCYVQPAAPLQDGILAKASDWCRIDSNTADRAPLYQGTHASNVWFSNNRVTDGGLNGNLAASAPAIGGNGTRRRFWATGNVISLGTGTGIFLHSTAVVPNLQRGIVIDGNSFNGLGAWIETQANDTRLAPVTIASGVGAPCTGQTNFPTPVEIINNTIGTLASNTGFATMQIGEETWDCPGDQLGPVLLQGNTIHPVTWGAHAAELVDFRGLAIGSTGTTLQTSGEWDWLSGSTGTCSGWTTNGTTFVTDSSGNAIGDCEP